MCSCAESESCPQIHGQLYLNVSNTTAALALSSMSSSSSVLSVLTTILRLHITSRFPPAKWTKHHPIRIPIESNPISSHLTPAHTHKPYTTQRPIDIKLKVKMSAISLPSREEFLEQLSSYPVQACAIIDGDTTSCAICTRDLGDTPNDGSEERAVLLHDTHAFGEECARKWLNSKNTCPCCRTVLYQVASNDDGDDVDAVVDDFVPIAPTFDEEELEHLLWQAGQLSTRDPRTEAFSDHEVMAIYWALWNQWQLAIDSNVDGTWELEDPRSNGVASALHELLRVRYSWWRHSPEQLNLNITGRFVYPAGSWMPTDRDLHRHVVIDFEADLQSDLYLMEVTDHLIAPAFNDGSNCINVSGHPAVVLLIDRIDGLLQNLTGRKIRVDAFRRRLREWVGDADQMESDGVHPLLPLGYADLVRHLVDQTTLRAIRRTRESRLARRARRPRPVSRAPRMSAPSRSD